MIWPVATATATSSMYLLPGPSAVADWLTPFEDLAMRSTSVATRYLACFAAGNRKVSEWRRRLVFFVLQLPRDTTAPATVCDTNCHEKQTIVCSHIGFRAFPSEAATEVGRALRSRWQQNLRARRSVCAHTFDLDCVVVFSWYKPGPDMRAHGQTRSGPRR